MVGRYGKPKPWAHLYNTAAWKALRHSQLSAEPLCAMCMKDGGRITAATVCDHKIAHKGSVTLFYDRRNLQSLCKLHHDSSKQRQEHRGVEIGCDAQGNPIDANHHWNAG